jgi:anti-anti-sigma factor
MQSDRLLAFHWDDEPSLLVDLQFDVEPDGARMVLSGDLDALNAERLQKAVLEVLRHQPHSLDLDLSGATFLDAAGISALLLCKADAEQVECPMTLSNPSFMAYRVLEVVGLLDHFGVATPPGSGSPARRAAKIFAGLSFGRVAGRGAGAA